MNITKEYFEKKLKKHGQVTAYSQENIPLNISREFYIARDGSNPTLEFDINCVDLAHYCEHMGLRLSPTNND